MTTTDPRADLFFCDHWSCWLLPRACAARHRAARRKRRWGPSPKDGDWMPMLCGTYCRDCEIGREHARREDEMAKKKSVDTARGGPRFSWLD